MAEMMTVKPLTKEAQEKEVQLLQKLFTTLLFYSRRKFGFKHWSRAILDGLDFCCSKKGLEDKILVPKPPRNCARKWNQPRFDGPYCQDLLFNVKKFKHLDTIPETELDEFIKSSVEILVPIPSESEVVPEMCDVPFHDNSLPLDISKDQFEDFSESNDVSTLSDDDSPYGEDIDYVDASPPDVEIVSLEVVEIVVPEVGKIDDDIL
ncbi:hypothetical protein Tco_0815055 [Tanacetum coccineum]